MKPKGEKMMTTLMEQIKSVEVGVEASILVKDGTFLEVSEIREFFDLEISPQEDWRVYGSSAKQAYELDDHCKYLVAHIEGGGNSDNCMLPHYAYENLSKEEVLKLVEANLQDYLTSYLLIFEQDDYIGVKESLKDFSTELATFGWVLDQNFDPEMKDSTSSCLFTVPTLWLADTLLDHPWFKDYVEGDDVSPDWFDLYTHADGYTLYQAAKEAGMLLNVKIAY